MLEKYVVDLAHVTEWTKVPIEEDVMYKKKLVTILERDLRVHHNMRIPLVKVIWKHCKKEEATWELVGEKYSRLFHFHLKVVL